MINKENLNKLKKLIKKYDYMSWLSVIIYEDYDKKLFFEFWDSDYIIKDIRRFTTFESAKQFIIDYFTIEKEVKKHKDIIRKLKGSL